MTHHVVRESCQNLVVKILSSELELVQFKTLDQFSLSYFEIRGFNPCNQILLTLFDISNTFDNSI